MTDVKMSVKTTEEKRGELDQLAKEEGITRTELLSRIIDAYLGWCAGKGSFATLLDDSIN